MIKHPSLHQCTFPTTNIPGIHPPFPPSPCLHSRQYSPYSLSTFGHYGLQHRHWEVIMFDPLSTFGTHLPPQLVPPVMIFLVIPSLLHLSSPLHSSSFPAMGQSPWPMYLLSLGVSLIWYYSMCHKWVQSFYVYPSLSDSFHLAYYPCLSIYKQISWLHLS